MRVLKVLLWIVAFLVVGGIGFFVGGAGGAAVGALGGGIGGTLMGACTAAQVGVAKGILTPEQQTALIDATAESLRGTYADLLAQLNLPEEERLTAANCPRLIERFKPQPAVDAGSHGRPSSCSGQRSRWR